MKITLDDVDDFARGAALLGTGGGGDPYIGSLMLRQAIEDSGPVELVDVDTLKDTDFVAPVAMIGAPTALVEKIPNGDEIDLVLSAVERDRGVAIQAVLCAEIGGLNALLPRVAAARRGLGVVDGDGMGRAFPQLQMITYHLFGVPIAPLAMADESSNVVLIDAADANDVERLCRHLVVGMGGSATMCLYSMLGADAKRSMVRGTLSLALEIGRAIRRGRSSALNPVDSLLAFLAGTRYYHHSRRLFTGKVASLLRETRGGWAMGHVVIEGNGPNAGERLEIQFQNEYLVARQEGCTVVVVPDLLAILDDATAEPITTESLKYGQRVVVIGIRAAPVLRSPAALQVMGPQAFGLEAEYLPLEGKPMVDV